MKKIIITLTITIISIIGYANNEEKGDNGTLV